MCVYSFTVILYYSPFGVRYCKQIPWVTTVTKICDCYYESYLTKETFKFLEDNIDSNVVVDGNKYSIDEIEEHVSYIGPRTGIVSKISFKRKWRTLS